MTVDTGITVQDIEGFLLILIRIASFVNVAPVFNMSSTPQRVKMGLSVFIALIIYVVAPIEIPEYHSVGEFSLLILAESVTGILIGFSAYLCFSAIFLRAE